MNDAVLPAPGARQPRIAVVGTGYVGLSMAVLLAQHNHVTALDIDVSKINKLNSRISPIVDQDITNFLAKDEIQLFATTDKRDALNGADIIIVATPTDYDPDRDWFNTETVESVVKDALEISPNSLIVIKSTVPVGFTDRLCNRFNANNIVFSPEFLREGRALADNLAPSRIIIGNRDPRSVKFAHLLKDSSVNAGVPILLTGNTEAEAIKLFSNTYLAMRVGFFNEVDTFAYSHNIQARDVIEGICHDPRIGRFYNNPSFGYGGYCLPKDTKQMLSNFKDIPQALIGAIVNSNPIRQNFIANKILQSNPRTVGVYRLAMKAGSDNFRSSSIIEVIKHLKTRNVNVIIFEPNTAETTIFDCPIITDLVSFKKQSDIVVTNRMSDDLLDIPEKIFTRDLFGQD